MKIHVLIILFVLSACGNKQKNDHNDESYDNFEKEIVDIKSLEIYDFDEFEPLLNKSDKTYVVNFWATWCAPCIKELPHFEDLNKNYQNKNVEVILVSLDFPRHYDKKLKPFIKKHDLKSRVVALNDPDSNTWIPKVSESWSGAIPATLIYNKDKRQFYERSFNYEELKTEIEQFLN